MTFYISYTLVGTVSRPTVTVLLWLCWVVLWLLVGWWVLQALTRDEPEAKKRR